MRITPSRATLPMTSLAAAGAPAADVPALCAIPMPDHQISFRRDDVAITRHHSDPDLCRPFIFPGIGASGRPLTRCGHPHDSVGHAHHTSIGISHPSVADANLWEERRGLARIVHRRIERLTDGPDETALVAHNEWPARAARRRSGSVVAPPFGVLGVRVAKTMSVRDGGARSATPRVT